MQTNNRQISFNQEVEELLRSFENKVLAYAEEAEVPMDVVLTWISLPEIDPMDIELIDIRHDYSLFEKLEDLREQNINVAVSIVDSNEFITGDVNEMQPDDAYGAEQEEPDRYLPSNVYLEDFAPRSADLVEERSRQVESISGKVTFFSGIFHPFRRRRKSFVS